MTGVTQINSTTLISPTSHRPNLHLYNTRAFASVTLDTVATDNGKKFKALTDEMVAKLQAEFKAVDVNNDGKIDSEELKELLRKNDGSFKEAEILEISELFYVGNSAKPVSIENLLQAIDSIMISSNEQVQGSKSLGVGSCAAEYYYDSNHHQWKEDELDIDLTHVKPESFSDKLAYSAVKGVRVVFDVMTGWNGNITTQKIMQRTIFLETVAGVPGMVAAIIRHFKSLRHMERDGGHINMFLEEATNERMHLLSFVRMRDPSLGFRAAVIGSQFIFGSGFLLSYIISPNFCHRFVGYIEEEACDTYTKIIHAIEEAPEGSDLAKWRTERAPNIGISYWHLGENGTVLDMIYAIRKDESEHRDVNHSVCNMKPGEVNPRFDPSRRLDEALNKYVRDMMKRPPST